MPLVTVTTIGMLFGLSFAVLYNSYLPALGSVISTAKKTSEAADIKCACEHQALLEAATTGVLSVLLPVLLLFYYVTRDAEVIWLSGLTCTDESFAQRGAGLAMAQRLKPGPRDRRAGEDCG